MAALAFSCFAGAQGGNVREPKGSRLVQPYSGGGARWMWKAPQTVIHRFSQVEDGFEHLKVYITSVQISRGLGVFASRMVNAAQPQSIE